MDFDKMAINAAIEALLVDPFDADSASVVIQFGSTLPDSQKITYESIRITKTDDDSITAHTQEQGNVSVKHEHEEKKEYIRGVKFERAGFYKIRRSGGRIIFQNFWKTDITTQGNYERPPEYSVLYDRNTLEYKDFCVKIEKKIGCRWFFGWFLQVSREYWRSLKTGKETYAGFSISISRTR